MRRLVTAVCISLVVATGAAAAQKAAGANAAKAGEPSLEPPTIHCLGVRWLVSGDANGNATVGLSYRKTGAREWLKALPLLRVTTEALTYALPEGATLFAGSVLELEPDTQYDLSVKLTDPDGGGATRTLGCRLD